MLPDWIPTAPAKSRTVSCLPAPARLGEDGELTSHGLDVELLEGSLQLLVLSLSSGTGAGDDLPPGRTLAAWREEGRQQAVPSFSLAEERRTDAESPSRGLKAC